MAEENQSVTSISDDENLATLNIGKKDDEKENKQQDKTSLLDSIKKNKAIAIGIGSVIVVLLILIPLAVLAIKDKKKGIDIAQTIIEKMQPKLDNTPPSKLQEMMKQADTLYQNGQTQKALDLYSKIAKYEEFLTFHNLGVVDMKAKKYKSALENFEKSIQSNQNKCVSAINAAVASLYLNKNDLFKHYINLAKKYLPTVLKDPLYDYYYSLIMYYENKYIESLSILRNKEIKYYKEEQYDITSNMLASLEDDYASIAYLEKQENTNNLALGLLYSKIKEYKTAISYLIPAKSQNHELASMALYMSYLKNGNIVYASEELTKIIERYRNKPTQKFPSVVFLKETLFNTNKAQEIFRKNISYPDDKFYKLFLYFTPYKMYNTNQTIDYIRKGSKSFYIDHVTLSRESLSTGNKLSKLNFKMAEGIKLAINYKIRDANNIFKNLEKDFKFNSILSYNLALTYAQLGEYGKASEYFNKSYSLNNKNKISTILSVISMRLANLGNGDDLLDIVSSKINQEDLGIEENYFYESVISYLRGILNPTYIDTSFKSDRGVLNIFYKMVLSSAVDNQIDEKKFAKELKTILGDNIISNILTFSIENKTSSRKNLAQNAIAFMKTNEIFLDILYYGPIVVKEMYIDMANISGMGYILRDILKERLITEQHDVRGVMQALAYLDIKLNFFEESFSIYNTLIDDFGENDANTLFFAAVAAMGSKKHANAIALLELSVLDKTLINAEARFALAMLYQENFNLKSANIHLKKINNNNFNSKYFDFNLRKEK